MLDRLLSLFGRKPAPRVDLGCPACGADNPEHATHCRKCGKSLDNYWRREMAAFTRDYDDAFNSGVYIMRREDSCPACQAIQGITYLPWELPRIPVDECTHPEGCRCGYLPVTKVSLGFPGMGFRARRRDREERQREAARRRAQNELRGQDEQAKPN